ncbi:T-box-containing protein, partial [Ophiophagus hannah]
MPATPCGFTGSRSGSVAGTDFQAQSAPLEASSTPPHSSVAVTLEEPDLWAKFHHAGTEMIITRTGRRMFPQFKIKITGLIPYAKYLMLVDFVPTDNFRYKWNKDQWEIAGKAEPQPPCQTYIHPDSPALGSHWMKEPLSFQKLKLTNNTLDQQGHVILHSMHRYKPRFHVMQADGLFSTCCSVFYSFSFPETVFTSVTTYQNEKVGRCLCLQEAAQDNQSRPWEGGSLGCGWALGLVLREATCLGLLLVTGGPASETKSSLGVQVLSASLSPKITKLKIYNNPFAKGFREHGKNVRPRERTGRGRNPAKVAKMAAPQLPAGEGVAVGSCAKGKAKGSLTARGPTWLSGPSSLLKIPAWGVSGEQQEGLSAATSSSQAHRFPAAGEVSLPAPSKDLSTFNEFWVRPQQLDFPMAPERDPKPHESLAATPLLPFWQDAGVTGHVEEPAGKPKPQGLALYAPDQSFSQWVVPPPSDYRARSYAAFSAGSSGSAARGRADWSQCPLFPYACW